MRLIITTILSFISLMLCAQCPGGENACHTPGSVLPFIPAVPGGYTTEPDYRQDPSETSMADNTIEPDDPADIFINFQYDTSDDEIFIVYTTDGTCATKTNGTVINASFSTFSNPNRLWYGQIPVQLEGTIVNYVIYANSRNDGDNSLAGANNRISPNGFEQSWTEGDACYTYESAILPVGLADFELTVYDEQSVLKWKTFFERDFSHFEIQLSADAESFYTAGKIDGRNSATGSSYSFTLPDDNSARYIRLKMVDLDGTIEYSAILNMVRATTALSYYIDAGTIYFETPQESIHIFSQTGRHILSAQASSRLDISTLTSGVYYLNVNTQTESFIIP